MNRLMLLILAGVMLSLTGCGFNVDGQTGKMYFCDVVTMKCHKT